MKTHNEIYKTNQKVYFNWSNGHTYYLKGKELYLAPTFTDGSIDIDNELHVNDMDKPHTEYRINMFINYLSN